MLRAIETLVREDVAEVARPVATLGIDVGIFESSLIIGSENVIVVFIIALLLAECNCKCPLEEASIVMHL